MSTCGFAGGCQENDTARQIRQSDREFLASGFLTLHSEQQSLLPADRLHGLPGRDFFGTVTTRGVN